MSNVETLLKSIYNEINELKSAVNRINETLLDIKIMLLKEEELSKEEKEELKRLLKEPKENFVSLDEIKGKLNL